MVTYITEQQVNQLSRKCQEEFEAMLKKNDIIIPPTGLKRLFFEKRWRNSYYAYLDYCADLEKYLPRLVSLKESLVKRYGEFCPAFPFEDAPVLDFSFANHIEALAAISAESEHFEEISSNLLMLEEKLEKQARANWLKFLVSGADEDCVLIVIQDQSTSVTSAATANFNASVKQGKEHNIVINPCGMVWVAFDPHTMADESYYDNILITTPSTSTVRYIKKSDIIGS